MLVRVPAFKRKRPAQGCRLQLRCGSVLGVHRPADVDAGQQGIAQRKLAGTRQGRDEVGDAATLAEQGGIDVKSAPDCAARGRGGRELLGPRTGEPKIGAEHGIVALTLQRGDAGERATGQRAA